MKLAQKSSEMMTRSFQKSRYRFDVIPPRVFNTAFGIYIHVPFCRTMCRFCPFYKERYSDEKKNLFLAAIEREIGHTRLDGDASWLYIGGGTPNVLSLGELSRILDAIRAQTTLPPSVGIELHPSLLDTPYLEGLKEAGFTKVSMGIESLRDEVLAENGRQSAPREHIERLLCRAHELGLWSNVDMMVGLAKQQREPFLDDIRALATLTPSQVTIYPYMVLRNGSGLSSMSDAEQFRLIEEAGAILRQAGYQRKSVWVFGRGDDIYDSSRDELVTDYAGFGPCAFSTYDTWKAVNPELSVYLDNYRAESVEAQGFICPKAKATDEWRRFARMIYDLTCHRLPGAPLGINAFVALLSLAGYRRGNALSPKGVLFAHQITKTVVESLPFPIQNPSVIDNHDEYLARKAAIERQHSPEVV